LDSGYLNSADTEYSPIFGIQAALNSGRHHTPDVQNQQEVSSMQPDDPAFSIGLDIDSTPNWVAAYGLGAIALLALLKWGGFRFVIGNTR
jgi:hypothetical protein